MKVTGVSGNIDRTNEAPEEREHISLGRGRRSPRVRTRRSHKCIFILICVQKARILSVMSHKGSEFLYSISLKGFIDVT